MTSVAITRAVAVLSLILGGMSSRGVAETLSGAAGAPTQYAAVEGRRIAYRSIGTGPPVVLANRFRGVLDTWDPAFIDALARNYRVVLFDYSGLGLSEGTPGTSIQHFAKDVSDLAGALKLGRVVLGGWSFGGLVAQTAAVQYPQLASHLILIGTGPPGKTDHPPEKAFLERALKSINDLADETVLFFEPESALSVEAAKRTHDRIESRKTDRSVPVPEELWANYVQAGAEFREDKLKVRQKLAAGGLPMLMISGDHDISFPVENWYALTRTLPTLHMVVLPASGHAPQHQYPDLTARYIAAFAHNTK